MIDILLQKAKDTGLDACGVAKPTEEVLKLFPYAKSVISCALTYNIKCNKNYNEFYVAKAAFFFEYHDALRALLAELSEALPLCRLDICVDTTPIPERKIACLAGIGRRCRNGNISIDGRGSMCVLGEIITDLEIETSTEIKPSLCGDCDICVRSCPVQAIKDDGAIDKSSCISALTQRGGIMSRDEMKNIGYNIYGCDKCLDVCPQNNNVKAQPMQNSSFYDFPIEYLLALTKEQFNSHIRNTPIGWIGRNKIRRNAIIVCANLGNVSAVPVLRELAEDESPVISNTAKAALKILL